MIAPAILDDILAHAAAEFPREACGLLIDTGVGISVIRAENTHPDPTRAFLINPLLYARHARQIRAVYHSHPNRSPEPSAADIASAERSNLPFMIVSYPGGELHTYTPRGVLPAAYEGRPFVYGVLDCLNLVADYYRHELDIDIRDGERKQWGWWDDPANANAFVNGFLARSFQRVDVPQANDIIIMQLNGAACPAHAAIYLGDSRILHHPSASCRSRVEMFGQYWRQATVVYLRFCGDAAELSAPRTQSESF
ncbi:C40 family peptidase [Methylomonas sp. CM2]|uniref:C40 family peptidase n=1 Tax=Methylomonas sp. CM2 TaxID=3417647 RepID=UPI003CEFC3B9